MFVKYFLEYAFDKLGLAIIAKWRLASLPLSTRMKKIIKEYQIDCVIDVGANIGQYGQFLRNEVGYSGLIISFEPDPSNFNCLKEASKHDKQWVVIDYALGKEVNKLPLNIMENSVFNSFLTPNNIETDQFKDENSVIKIEEVSIRRLDVELPELVKNYGFDHVFLKLDTQGFDLEVFEGAFGCLDKIKGVQTEVSVVPIYENMPKFGDTLTLFRSKGFEVCGIYAVSENRFPHAVEFDCLFLPKGLLLEKFSSS